MTAQIQGFLTREQVGLKPAKGRTLLNGRRMAGVTLHHGAGASPTDHGRCIAMWREYQRMHQVDNGWFDVAYSMGVCPCGWALEGRGWALESGANGTAFGNDNYFAICVIGNGDTVYSGLVRDAVEWCLYYLRTRGNAGDEVRTHSSFVATSCPGSKLTALAADLDGKALTLPTLGGSVPPPYVPPGNVGQEPVPTPADVESLTSRLARGDKGDEVGLLQEMLNALDGAGLTVDRSFGPSVEAAVVAAQKKRGLAQDGRVGPATRAALNTEWAARFGPAPQPLPAPIPEPDPEPEPAPVPEPEPVPTPPPPAPKPPPAPVPPAKDTIGETLRRGDTGKAVTYMQERLTYHGIPTTTDGSFGPAAEANVKAFQKARGLLVDGICGPATWAALRVSSQAERRAEARTILAMLGWRVNTDARLTQAILDYQGACNLPGIAALAKDGKVGPATIAALRMSRDRRNAGKHDISANFSAREFACKCGGKYSDCRRIWISRNMVIGAEKLRTIYGPFTPISACRCPRHNVAQGGSPQSQHMTGYALDIPARFTVAKIKGLRYFHAIGHNGSVSTGTVRHVDNRAAGPSNIPRVSGNPATPYTYGY